MQKRDAERLFLCSDAREVARVYGYNDPAAWRKSWGVFTHALLLDGAISARQYDNWDIPKDLAPRAARSAKQRQRKTDR